jgi:hypothetical protein
MPKRFTLKIRNLGSIPSFEVKFDVSLEDVDKPNPFNQFVD